LSRVRSPFRVSPSFIHSAIAQQLQFKNSFLSGVGWWL